MSDFLYYVEISEDDQPVHVFEYQRYWSTNTMKLIHDIDRWCMEYIEKQNYRLSIRDIEGRMVYQWKVRSQSDAVMFKLRWL